MDTTPISPEVQERLNQPLQNPAGLADADQAFLNLLVDKVDRGQINLMQPGTLINNAVYETLQPQDQGKIDFDAVNLAAVLRNIYGLWKATNGTPTFQIANLVEAARLTKERIETISGDVFVI